VYIPLPRDYCDRIEAMLREGDVFLTNGINAENPYVMAEYLNSEVQVFVHIDRNILSHIIDLVRGITHPKSGDDPQMLKLSAACWAFCGVIDSAFSPTWGTYEYGWSQGHERALDSMRWFMHAVEIEPRYYAAVAMGDLSPCDFAMMFPANEELPAFAKGEFERRLNNWKASYWTVLKIAQIQRLSMKPEEKLTTLAEWMVEEAVLNIFGLSLAIIGFSPSSEFGFLKGMGSNDPEKLRSRIHNLAWDIAHPRGWYQSYRASKNDEIWIFASLDRGLRHLGKFVFSFKEADERLSDQETLFRRHWGTRYLEIQRLVHARENRCLDVDREDVVKQRLSNMDDSISELEAELGLVRGI